MTFYEDFISGINRQIGSDKKFKNKKQFAEQCGVQSAQVTRYLNGERQDFIKSLGNIIDTSGAKLVFPDEFIPSDNSLHLREIELLKTENAKLQAVVNNLNELIKDSMTSPKKEEPTLYHSDNQSKVS